ncbi:nicotinate-nucleotide adenylyltransferase [[Mycoplasma] collis]|uniref:nicotinate-nucleotide adenylyltransferase n=1 Tax=[Mycoplasma] collis TaxID=2127 RepID=UPI00051AE813|nr:nicotinate-nucleotide adenylyltransferase [[Mycoplasma] collis]
MKKIAIFGGSFNPIHNAHIKIAEYAIKHLKLDKLIFVPTFKSPDKVKDKIAEPHHRVKMIELVLLPKSEISLFEINRKGISYTIDTIKYFSEKFKDAQLYFLIGSDNLTTLHKWEEIETISKLAKIVVFKRTKNFSKINLKKFNAQLLNNDIFDASSTEIRKGNFKNLNPLVNEYIGKNWLYIEEILKNTLEAKRHKHSVATGELAAEYAKSLNYDSKIAWFAGLCHDITKNWTIEKHRQFLNENNIKNEQIEDYKLHQLTGSLWLKNVYKLQNKEIINAISVHTSLSKKMNVLDKIVFMADKLSKGRKFEGIQKIRNLAFNDFEAAFSSIVEKTKNFNLNKTTVSDEQLEIYNIHIK